MLERYPYSSGHLYRPPPLHSEEEGQDMFQRGLYEEAIQHWKKAAKAGDAGASYRLSVEYSNANVVKRDMQLALEYLEASVEGDDPRGLQDMGSFYDEGIFGYERNPEKAAQFYLRAAAMGNSAAMFNAAAILELGEAVLHKTGLRRINIMFCRATTDFILAVEA